MREESLSPWNLKDKIEDILLNTTLKEDEKFFLARMLYPHIDAADYVELAKIRKGDKKNIDLAFKTEDSEGNIYTIRPLPTKRNCQISNDYIKRKSFGDI